MYWTAWSEEGPPVSRSTQWTKIGPLVDIEEADRHHRLRTAAAPRLVVWATFEPDDGVNSLFPRGLAKPFTGTARAQYALPEPQKRMPPRPA